jgi:ABC-2 type transport system ATP-binding protein
VVIIDGGRIKADDTPRNLVSDMRAAGRVQAEIQVAAETALPILSDLPNVKKASGEEFGEGWVRFNLWSDSGSDTRQAISDIAALNNWPLRSLFRHEATLEDVFVELTRRD